MFSVIQAISQHSLTSFMALFPVINPIGISFIINSFLKNLTPIQKKIIVKQIVLYSFLLCLGSLLLGQIVLTIFHLSIPIVQIGGGFLICKFGLQLLSSTPSTSQQQQDGKNEKEIKNTRFQSIKSKLFYPITFPIVIDAGSISVIFALAASSFSKKIETTAINFTSSLIAIILCCACLYIFTMQAVSITRKIGASGAEIINKLCAFFTFCVGLNVIYEGITTLIKTYH